VLLKLRSKPSQGGCTQTRRRAWTPRNFSGGVGGPNESRDLKRVTKRSILRRIFGTSVAFSLICVAANSRARRGVIVRTTSEGPSRPSDRCAQLSLEDGSVDKPRRIGRSRGQERPRREHYIGAGLPIHAGGEGRYSGKTHAPNRYEPASPLRVSWLPEYPVQAQRIGQGEAAGIGGGRDQQDCAAVRTSCGDRRREGKQELGRSDGHKKAESSGRLFWPPGWAFPVVRQGFVVRHGAGQDLPEFRTKLDTRLCATSSRRGRAGPRG